MKNLTSVILRALVALTIFTGSSQAFASPIYHVTVDSSGLSGQGYLDFLFLGTLSAATADVKLTNFTGAFDTSTATMINAEGSLATGVTIHNDAGWNEFAQLANFGGLFGFDVEFSVANDASGGTTLSIALLDAGLNNYAAGTSGDLATVQLYPSQAPAFSVGARAVAGPAAVPEPATMAQMGLGLALLLGSLRRRRG